MAIRAVVPAAGIGSRMQSSIPKQYLPLQGQSVLSHTLERLCAQPEISSVMVVLSADDRHWCRTRAELSPSCAGRLLTCQGGEDRWQSVLNALDALSSVAGDGEWVLVHDAVRPCVRDSDIRKLLNLTQSSQVGGLLARPVSDTLKRQSLSRQGGEEAMAYSEATVSRERMWAACTPQLFPLGILRDCLRKASSAGAVLTDEASALEWCGHQPALVPCHQDNIKITYADDLALAGLILQAQILQARDKRAEETAT